MLSSLLAATVLVVNELMAKAPTGYTFAGWKRNASDAWVRWHLASIS